MKAISNIGRILFAIPFLVFGLGHLGKAEAMAPMVPVPGGVFWIYFTGIALIAAGASFITGKLVQISGILLAILLLTFVITIHLPHLGNPEMKQIAYISLLKDTSLAGASLFIAGTFYNEKKN